MDGILNIFNSLVNSETNNLPVVLNSLEEHQSFRAKNLSANDPVIQHITSLLSRPPTRHEGFLILTTFLEQCSLEVIEQKAVLWTTIAIKTCNQKGSDRTVPYAYGVLGTLILKSVEIPELSKSFSNGLVSKICDTINNVQSSGYISALKCIETCLRIYPGPCGPARTSIEQFISKLSDSIDDNLVNWSGKCFHLLQQVRGGGMQGLSHKVAWQIYQIKLCGSLHNILDLMFANCSEVYDEPKEKSQLNLKPLELSDEPVQRAIQLYLRFKNLVTYLILALREPFPVSKSIMPKKIINIIARGLSVNCNMLEKNKISDNLAIGALLPSFQISFLKLMDTLILILRSHLFVHYKVILGFIYETLRWTSSKKSSGCQKPYVKLRIAAYNTLSLWCTTFQYGSCVEIISDGILEQVLFDISPFQNEFTLQVLSGAKKHMSKKARKQLHKAQNEKSNLAQAHSKSGDSHKTKILYSDKGNQILCLNALRCLRTILNSASIFLKPPLIKEIHNKILKICIYINGSCKLSVDHLYENSSNRKELYDVLLTLITASNHLCPPPTQIALKLLTDRQIYDNKAQLREMCSNLLKIGEKLIHPQKECLYFPSDIRDIKNVFSKFGKPLDTINGNNDGDNDDDEDDEDDDDDDDASMGSDDDIEENVDDNENDGNIEKEVHENCADVSEEIQDDQTNIDNANKNNIIDLLNNENDDAAVSNNELSDSIKQPNSSTKEIELKQMENQPITESSKTIELENNNDNEVDLTNDGDDDDCPINTNLVRKRKLDEFEIITCPDSPDIVLRVDDDDDDDDDEVELIENIDMNSSIKKPRFDLEKVDQENDNNKSNITPENDDDLVAAIAATFVDELI